MIIRIYNLKESWKTKKIFQQYVEHRTKYLKDSVYAAGGIATVWKVKPLTSTFSEFAVRLLNVLYRMEVDQKELMLFLTLFLTPLLSWNGNKNKLVDFIFKQWVSNSSLIGYKILIVANDKEAYKIESNSCMLIPELESNHKEADTNIFMIALSKMMEFNCTFYLTISAKSHKRITVKLMSSLTKKTFLRNQIQ